ncbi:Uncharacterised protein [uncultured archaeon]|nr:Uncharacterised protein [uncultured archaeon]
MIQNKRGLSTIVVTLIIVVLSLVAVGVVWAVVNGLLKTSSSNVDINSKCLGVSVEATRANCSDATSNVCTVTLSRTGTGADQIAGVKLIFKNDSAGAVSGLIDVPGDVPPLAGLTVTRDTGVAKTTFLGNFSTVQVASYFKDASGNAQICAQTTSFNFVSS